jgi:histone acetyltransferase HTATIP
VKVGCKVFALRPVQGGADEERLAEILSRRETDNGMEVFVHWENFNKRLDDWIPGSRVLVSRDMEWPRKAQSNKPAGAHKAQPPKAGRPLTLLKKALLSNYEESSSSSQQGLPGTPRRLEDEGDEDADGEMDISMDLEEGSFAQSFTAPTLSKEQEIEKLRTSGSMTQSISEITRVKNLNRLQIGRHEVEAWYFSPYPKEYTHLPILYICEFCLSYFPSQFMLGRHRQRCTLLHPPGNEIYRDEDISFFELDGKKQLTWCRNLSLLSKCFLDQ